MWKELDELTFNLNYECPILDIFSIVYIDRMFSS